MLNVQIAQTIIGVIAFLLAYCISVSITGYCASWFALKMGDDTPEQEGFLTLNPMVHIDLVGTLFLMLYHFGWSRFIPINPFNIDGRYRGLKVLAAFLAESVMHFIVSLISIWALIGLFGKNFLTPLALRTIEESSSYAFSIGLVLVEFWRVNVFLCVIMAIINMLNLFVIVMVEKKPEYSMYLRLALFIIPLALFYLFRNVISFFAEIVGSITIFICSFIASLLHLF